MFSLFDNSSTFLSYKCFMTVENFPIPFREYSTVLGAIPRGLMQLVKGHIHGHKDTEELVFFLDGIGI